MFFDKPETQQRLSDTGALGEPSTFAERTIAAFKSTQDRNFGVVNGGAMLDAYEARRKAVMDAVGEDIGNPFTQAMNQLPPMGDANGYGMPGPLPELKPRGQMEADFQSALERLAEKHPDKRDIIAPHKPVRSTFASEVREREQKSIDAGRNYGGITGTGPIADFAGGMGSQVTDPVNAATILIGPTGRVGQGAKAIIGMGVKQGIANAGVEAAMAPLVQDFRRQMGQSYGLGEAAYDIGTAAALGFAADAGIRTAARGIQSKLGRKAILDADGNVTGYESAEASTARATRHAESQARAEQLKALQDDGTLQRAMDGDPEAIAKVDPILGLSEDPAVRGASQVQEFVELEPGDFDDIAKSRAFTQTLRAAIDADEPPPVIKMERASNRPSLSDDMEIPKGTEGNQHFRTIDIEGKPVHFQNLDSKRITTDADAMQFKSGGNQFGVTGALGINTTFDPAAAGKVIVFERADGVTIIVDGHQRLSIAKDGDQFQGFVFREKDGWSAAEVRAEAALKNIQEGRANLLDTVSAMREHGPQMEGRIAVDTDFMRQAVGMSRLSDAAFVRLEAGTIEPHMAALVGELVPDATKHDGVMQALLRANPPDEASARKVIGREIREPVTVEDQTALLGAQDVPDDLIAPRSEVLGDVVSVMRQGTPEQMAASVIIERLSDRPGYVSNLLTDAARAIHTGQPKTRVVDAFMRQIEVTAKDGGVEARIAELPRVDPLMLPKGNERVTAKLGDTVMTYSRVVGQDKALYIEEVATKGEGSGKGNARALLQGLAEQADVHGMTIDLLAQPGTRTTDLRRLVRLYESIGFVATSQTEHGVEMIRLPLSNAINQAIRDGSEEPARLFALSDISTGRSMRADLDKLGYYSKALEAAKAIKQAKGTPEQMLAQLKSAGVKQAELDAVNLADFLEGKKSVTRDDLVKHLTDNRVGVREKSYDRSPLDDTELANLSRNNGSAEDMLAAELGLGTDPAFTSGPFDRTKWSPYSLDPSNPSYRETVLHLPRNGEKLDIRRREIEALGRDATPAQKQEWADIMNRIRPDNRDVDGVQPFSGMPDFQSGHFPEPNIIGHMMTSMTRHEGKPVYTIDQIQSDWGQRLRDGGVRDEAKIAELQKKIDEAGNPWERIDEIQAELFGYQPVKWSSMPNRFAGWQRRVDEKAPQLSDEMSALLDAAERFQLLEAELRTAKAGSTGHPLVNTTDQWTNTTLRRALRQAVEADADYIAIPHGDTVLSYNPGDTDGMRGFYGSRTTEGIVPKNLRKLIEKLDPQAPRPVKIETLETPSGPRGWKENGERNSDKSQTGFTLFPITDKVRKSVTEEGQPLFSKPAQQQAPDMAALKSFTENLESVLKDAQKPSPPRLVDDVTGKDGKAHLEYLREEMADDIKGAVDPVTVEARTLTSTPMLDPSKPLIYTPEANARMADIRKEIDRTLQMLPPDVRIRAEDELVFNLNGGSDARIAGLWDGYDRLVYVALSGNDPVRAVRHEVIHALKQSGLLTADEFKQLYAFSETLKLRGAYKVDERYLDLYTKAYGERGSDYVENLLREETIAEMFADYSLNGRRFGDVAGGGLVDRLIDRIVSFMKLLRDNLGFLGFKNVNDIFQAIESGEVASRPSSRNPAGGRSPGVGARQIGEAVGGERLASFAGERANTADIAALSVAKQMEVEGKPREDIWHETGWFKGVDGKWRFEISDDKARWNLMRAIEQENGTVGEFMTHGKLMDAYPDLAAAKATTNGFGAAYFPGTDTVQIGGQLPLGQFPTSAALHELQHAVQSREGFAKGGSSLDGDIYNQISGEAEARLVQKRQKMTADERRARPPWLDYDVPEAEQIVRMSANGQQMSLGQHPSDMINDAIDALPDETATAIRNVLNQANIDEAQIGSMVDSIMPLIRSGDQAAVAERVQAMAKEAAPQMMPPQSEFGRALADVQADKEMLDVIGACRA